MGNLFSVASGKGGQICTEMYATVLSPKITPYEAEFIFHGLRKGRPNLHRNVRHRLKLRK